MKQGKQKKRLIEQAREDMAASWIPNYSGSVYVDHELTPESEIYLSGVSSPSGTSDSKFKGSRPQPRDGNDEAVKHPNGFSLNFTKVNRAGGGFGSPPTHPKPVVDFSNARRPWEVRDGLPAFYFFLPKVMKT